MLFSVCLYKPQINIITLPKETVIAIIYKNIKAIVCSPDGDTNNLEIDAGVLQGDTLTPYLVILCLN